MRLFTPPPTPRSLRPVGPHRETIAQRLARAGRPADARVRALLESWFNRLPQPARADVRSRFWERDRRLALAAFWELYLHEMFRRLGFQLMLHPVGGNSGTRPDFLVIRGKEAFYVEALVQAPPTEAWRAERRLYPILDVLHEIRHSAVGIRLAHVEYGHGTPPLRELREALCAWLQGLEGKAPHPARLTWKRNSWTLEFEAVPAGDEGDRLAAPLIAGQGSAVPSERALAAKLQAKARRYRTLPHPLVLALCTAQTVEPVALVDLLMRIVPGLPEPVHGVLVTSGLDPWGIARTPLYVFSVPGRKVPVPVGLAGVLERFGAVLGAPGVWILAEPWTVFGLPPEWPNDQREDAPEPAVQPSDEVVSPRAALE